MNSSKLGSFRLLLAALMLGSAMASMRGYRPKAKSANTFRFIVIPDSQIYAWAVPGNDLSRRVTNPGGTLPFYNNMTAWIAKYAQALNIRFVSHVGDLTQNGEVVVEWERVNEAFSILEKANIPYGTAIGNHDYDVWPSVNSTNYLNCLGPWRFENQSYYGGASPTGLSSFQIITHQGQGILFLHICYTTPTSELDWASQVLKKYPQHLVFVTTHKYTMDFRVSFGRHGEKMKSGLARGVTVPEASDRREYHDTMQAQEFYDTFLQQHANIVMVHAGHFSSDVYRDDGFNGADLPVYEVILDLQDMRNGGDGYFRIVEVDLDNNKIHSSVYSPFWDRERTVIDNLAEDTRVLVDYAVAQVLPINEKLAELVQRLLIALMKDDVVPMVNVIAQHPDYLADPAWYEQLYQDQFTGIPTPTIMGTDSRLTDWEGLYMMAFAPNKNRPLDYGYLPNYRNPTYTLNVNFQDYLTKKVRTSKSLQRRLSEAWYDRQGAMLRRQQLRFLAKLPLIASPEEMQMLRDYNVTELLFTGKSVWGN